MIYHKWSLIGLKLWLRYGRARLRPWMSLTGVWARCLEHPGTNAFSRAEAAQLFAGATDLKLRMEIDAAAPLSQ